MGLQVGDPAPAFSGKRSEWKRSKIIGFQRRKSYSYTFIPKITHPPAPPRPAISGTTTDSLLKKG
jgi:hypothetical protein